MKIVNKIKTHMFHIKEAYELAYVIVNSRNYCFSKPHYYISYEEFRLNSIKKYKIKLGKSTEKEDYILNTYVNSNSRYNILLKIFITFIGR